MPDLWMGVQPVGVKFLFKQTEALQGVRVYRGTSYCDAVRRATGNEELLVLADSILTCQWSPVILGLKSPENSFERRLAPRMGKTWGYHLAPLSSFLRRDLEPDIIVIREEPATLKKLLSNIGWEQCALYLSGKMDKSALGILRNNKFSLKSAATVGVNKLLAALSNKEWWYKFTEQIFRNTFACNVFDRFISLFMADMSICRNSTVIPYKTGLVNVSHFCSGGIGWGLNHPHHLTSGFPNDAFKSLSNHLSIKWPETGNEVLPQSFLPQRDCGCSSGSKGNKEGELKTCSLNKRIGN